MENERRAHFVSRLDHLDLIMKYLEGKRNLRKEKEPIPLDLAMKEAYFKGSMLERVTSLENRLVQLCLELESSSTSSSTSTSASTSTSTSGYPIFKVGGSKGKGKPISGSLPTSINSNQAHNEASHQYLFSRSEIQEESETLLQKKKDTKPLQKQVGKKSGSKKEPINRSGKKVSSKWSHWKILGC